MKARTINEVLTPDGLLRDGFSLGHQQEAKKQVYLLAEEIKTLDVMVQEKIKKEGAREGYKLWLKGARIAQALPEVERVIPNQTHGAVPEADVSEDWLTTLALMENVLASGKRITVEVVDK